MANKKKKSADSSQGLWREVAALVGLFMGGFLALSFLSYRWAPTLAQGFALGNWGGKVGYLLVHALVGLLGISALWLIFFLFFFSFRYLSRHHLCSERFPLVILGCSGALISSSALSAVFQSATLTIFSREYPTCGIVGALAYRFLHPLLGAAGFVLFFILIFLLSIMLALRFSPSCLTCSLLSGISALRKSRDGRSKVRPPAREVDRVLGDGGKQPVIDITPQVPTVNTPPTESLNEEQEFLPLPAASGEFVLPSLQFLDKPKEPKNPELDHEHFMEVSRTLESKLIDFGVKGKVVGISPGPVITTYEFAPAPGVKISKVVSLDSDLALGLKAESVRIVGSVPGKAAIGIEIPNPVRLNVFFRDIIGTDAFRKAASPLTLGLGKDVVGNAVLANLADMPHLLIAGATGAGKSVGINTIICSILYKATPEEVRLLMVDPKRIELSAYENIPHLLHPVVVDPKMASRALQWAVLEMERRYGLMEETRVKSITSYNEQADEKLPQIVIIIDELADLMMVASKDVEASVARLAQMARAAGMHLILATQRPSVDVLTGLIKANFPTRISFKVSSKIDSRTIIDSGGAEHLLGKGDMLMMPPGSSRLQRIHGAYISESEIARVVDFLKQQRDVSYDETVMKIAEEEPLDGDDESTEDYDEKYDEAVAIVCESGQASISMVQRRLRIGYNRAARMIEMMEREGVVGPADGPRPREVLARKSY